MKHPAVELRLRLYIDGELVQDDTVDVFGQPESTLQRIGMAQIELAMAAMKSGRVWAVEVYDGMHALSQDGYVRFGTDSSMVDIRQPVHPLLATRVAGLNLISQILGDVTSPRDMRPSGGEDHRQTS